MTLVNLWKHYIKNRYFTSGHQLIDWIRLKGLLTQSVKKVGVINFDDLSQNSFQLSPPLCYLMLKVFEGNLFKKYMRK